MSQIQLYSAILCPFAHRVRLTLQAKGISFESIEIDPQNQPANFLKISPYGKVPVLKHGDNRIWESAIVNEYLEETFPDPPFHPWFEQLAVLEHFRGFGLPSGVDRLQEWQAAVAQQEAVRSIANSPEFYLERYGRLIQTKL